MLLWCKQKRLTRILAQDGVIHYLVVWKPLGLYADTWEAVDRLNHTGESIAEFHAEFMSTDFKDGNSAVTLASHEVRLASHRAKS